MVPLLFEGQKFHEVWDQLLWTLLTQGHEVKARQINASERLNVTVHVEDSRNNVLVNTGRDLNYRFMVAEWLWIAFGREDLATLEKYNKRYREFSDDGVTLSGAYGPRISKQLLWIMSVLQSDKDTRQAVIDIHSPMPLRSKDIPCTLTLQFFVRQNLLHCTVNMRSSDVWLGLPYDFFTFSMIQNGLAAMLGFQTGSLTMNLGSSHLYKVDVDLAYKAHSEWKSYTLRSPRLPEWPLKELETVLIQEPISQEPAWFHPIWSLYMHTLMQPTRVTSLAIMKAIDEYQATHP